MMKVNKNYILPLIMLISITLAFNLNLNLKLNHGLKYSLHPNIASYNVTPFTIYGNSGWESLSSSKPWCSGNGTWKNPYIIENIVIEGQGAGTCMTVRNSDVFFKIRNCTFFNAGMVLIPYTPYSGLYLYNVLNGKIENNMAGPDNGYGIFLEMCTNITLYKNNVSYNSEIGIYLENSDWNNLIQNEANYVERPPPTGGFGRGIWITSDYNNIYNNTTNFNEESGIDIAGKYNNITLHTANYNGEDSWDHGGATIPYVGARYNTFLNCTFKGNKMTGIYINSRVHYIRIINCKILNNGYGIFIRGFAGSHYHTISNNTFFGNSIGIFLQGGSDDGTNYNTISYNLFESQKSYAILFYEETNYNDIFGNYFYGKKMRFDGTIITNWNNSQIGNYWDDYSGVDENDDGIGDELYILSQGIDYLPIWCDGLNITIIDPIKNIYYSNPPEFAIKVNDLTLDKMWYTLNSSSMRYFSSQNGTINATAWSNCTDGSILITFYVNDTFGYITSKNITVRKDTTAPEIKIFAPIENAVHEDPPFFSLNITDSILNSTWYTLNYESTKYFFSEFSGNISCNAWVKAPEGFVTITFFANDTFNQINSSHIIVIKDKLPPLITLYSPKEGDIFYETAPRFNISIMDVSLHRTWYYLEGTTQGIDFSGNNGAIDQTTWDNLPYGILTITFYAEDSLGRISSVSLRIIKEKSVESDVGGDKNQAIPGFNLTIITATIWILSILIIKILKKNKGKEYQ